MIPAFLLLAVLLPQEVLHEGFEGETLHEGVHPGWTLDASDGRAEVVETGATAGRRALRLVCTDRNLAVKRTGALGVSAAGWRMTAKVRMAAGGRHRIVLLLRWIDAKDAVIAEDVSAAVAPKEWADLSMAVPRPPPGARRVVPVVRLEGGPGDGEALIDEIRVSTFATIRLKAPDRPFLAFAPGEPVRIAVEGASEARLILTDPQGNRVRVTVREAPGPVFDVGPLPRGAWRIEIRAYSGGRESARTQAWAVVGPDPGRGQAGGVLLRATQALAVDGLALLDVVGASSVGVVLDDPGRPGRHPAAAVPEFTAPLARRLETHLVGVRSRSEDFIPAEAHRVFDRWAMPPSDGLAERLKAAGCSPRVGPGLELVEAAELVDSSGQLTERGIVLRALNASCHGERRVEEKAGLRIERYDTATVLRALSEPVVYIVPEAATAWDPLRAPVRVEAGATLTVGARPIIILR